MSPPATLRRSHAGWAFGTGPPRDQSPFTSHPLTPLVRTNVCLFATTPLPSPMDVLQTLAVALGLAALSGYSLYLTVFLTGLAVHFDWIHLAPQYASLSVLADPAIIIISGILFVIAFLLLPGIWRLIGLGVCFIREKMNQPARRTAVELLADLPGPYERWFRKLVQPQQTVRWAVPCIAGKGKLIPRDQFGYLTATEEELAKLFFLVKGWFGSAKLRSEEHTSELQSHLNLVCRL